MRRIIAKYLGKLSRFVVDALEPELGLRFQGDESVAQQVLMQNWRRMALEGREKLPSFLDVGFRKYSQFEEDGILLFIFALIGTTNRKCVEICAGNGRECNAANLIINHGWWGFLFDGDQRNVQMARQFYSRNKDTFAAPPVFTKAWVTAENVNQIIADAGVSGPIDLLSLDIDGMDYWVWKGISAISPRVVVCETHNPIPPDQALTVPYDPQFVCKSENFRGASLAAMSKLGREKGYRLVGTHRFGFNAFFVKNGLGDELLPEVTPAACVNDPFSTATRAKNWPLIKDLPWQAV